MENVCELHGPKPSLPKREFPPPRIDKLVDSTAMHKLLMFMDAFSEHNQIKMLKKTKRKLLSSQVKGSIAIR